MRISTALALVLVGLILTASPGEAQTAQAPSGSGRLFLLFIDDLHLEFQSTPRVRVLIRRMMERLVGPSDRVGVVSSGYSSISERPTTDPQVVSSALGRVTGGGLRPAEVLAERGRLESSRRAAIALATARDLVASIADAPGPKVMLLVSGGYDAGPDDASNLTNDVAALADAATASGVVIYSFDARALVSVDDPQAAAVAPDAWAAHRQRSSASLRLLSDRTGGALVGSTGEFDAVMQALAASR